MQSCTQFSFLSIDKIMAINVTIDFLLQPISLSPTEKEAKAKEINFYYLDYYTIKERITYAYRMINAIY